VRRVKAGKQGRREIGGESGRRERKREKERGKLKLVPWCCLGERAGNCRKFRRIQKN